MLVTDLHFLPAGLNRHKNIMRCTRHYVQLRDETYALVLVHSENPLEYEGLIEETDFLGRNGVVVGIIADRLYQTDYCDLRKHFAKKRGIKLIPFKLEWIVVPNMNCSELQFVPKYLAMLDSEMSLHGEKNLYYLTSAEYIKRILYVRTGLKVHFDFSFDRSNTRDKNVEVVLLGTDTMLSSENLKFPRGKTIQDVKRVQALKTGNVPAIPDVLGCISQRYYYKEGIEKYSVSNNYFYLRMGDAAPGVLSAEQIAELAPLMGSLENQPVTDLKDEDDPEELKTVHNLVKPVVEKAMGELIERITQLIIKDITGNAQKGTK